MPDVTLFVRFDNVDTDSANLKKKDLSIRINDTPTQITDIRSVEDYNGVDENSAYLVLVDTSVSMRDQNQLSELRVLLEKLLSFSKPNDKTAVFRVSDKLETLKDFTVTDPSQNVTTNIINAISSGSGTGTGTYLYSGIREAYDIGRTSIDIPKRRMIVLISDGGVNGDSLSSDELKKYMDVDRLPVYTLILNQQNPVDEEFNNAASEIAQKTGGQSFISASGNELFARFKASNERCSVIQLRCDNFKAFNMQADIHIALKRVQGGIRQTAKFTATPAPMDRELHSQAVVNTEENLSTSYFGVVVILTPMILIVIFMIIFTCLLWIGKRRPQESKDAQSSTEQSPTTSGGSIGG